MSGFHERLSNLPPGTYENDPDAPWNQEGATPTSYLVEIRIRVTAINDDDARQQAGELLEKAGVRWADYDIEMAYEEP